MMTTADSPVRRRLTWSVRAQNLHGAGLTQLGWGLLFFGMPGVWWFALPAPTPAGWVAIGLASAGAILVLRGLLLGWGRNRLLATGAITAGTITGIKPTGLRASGIPLVEVTYAFRHDGGEARVTALARVSARLAVQAIDTLAAYLAARIREQAALREGANPDEAAAHPVLREITQLEPMALLRRIISEGWEAVLASYASRAAVAVAAEVVNRSARGKEIEEKALALSEQAPPSSIIGEQAGALLDATHARLTAGLPAEHWAGQMAHSLLTGARDFAAGQISRLCASGAELIFYDPRQPERAVPASALPYAVELTDDGRLRGGNLLLAMVVSILPTLVVLIHGITAVARYWPW